MMTLFQNQGVIDWLYDRNDGSLFTIAAGTVLLMWIGVNNSKESVTGLF